MWTPERTLTFLCVTDTCDISAATVSVAGYRSKVKLELAVLTVGFDDLICLFQLNQFYILLPTASGTEYFVSWWVKVSQ